jgi:hypothetical protein
MTQDTDERDPGDLIATLTHALQAQHTALDLLLAKLITVDPEFRPTQWRAVWTAVELGHKAIGEGMRWQTR